MIDLKIQFLGFPESEAVSAAVWDYVEHLEKLCDQIMSCHVVINRPPQKSHQGGIYHIKIRLHMRGANIIIDKEPGKNHAHEDVYVALRDAFDAAKRKVEDFMRIRSGRVKTIAKPMHARIIRLLFNEDCGFVLAEDQREIYFHRNSVLNQNFDDLKVGQEVRFSETMGENGPQITSMQVVGRSGHRVSL
ncbi:HPF/RaiA family ribosome-associated protein [Bdellovibrio svalbardensis]|uniref:HPF/RaiA family ribosome-associated protein n=1 Tax=Bdellovibrio svalbardensis TaxID=2972972 RepID=A0ABT6DGG9_9BACT|nr:HPF/RaiA family ribosome-associated protein [Bdellovibrio svalbardensis]MDG0815954.1 HPF/RaiA family ribosome-associated protein [Bdellovibrio svalbardensis]